MRTGVLLVDGEGRIRLANEDALRWAQGCAF